MNLLVLSILLMALLFAGTLIVVGVVVALLATRKEKRERVRISREAEKIDALLGSGKISEAEAGELKRAVGSGRILGPSPARPDTHIRIIGTLHMVSGALCLAGLLLLLPFLSLLGLHSTQAPKNNHPVEMTRMHEVRSVSVTREPVVWSVLCVGLLLGVVPFGLLRMIAAYKLMKGRNWARIAIIIFSVLELGNIPLGLALGIYSFWVLMIRDGAGEYFLEQGGAPCAC